MSNDSSASITPPTTTTTPDMTTLPIPTTSPSSGAYHMFVEKLEKLVELVTAPKPTTTGHLNILTQGPSSIAEVTRDTLNYAVELGKHHERMEDNWRNERAALLQCIHDLKAQVAMDELELKQLRYQNRVFEYGTKKLQQEINELRTENENLARARKHTMVSTSHAQQLPLPAITHSYDAPLDGPQRGGVRGQPLNHSLRGPFQGAPPLSIASSGSTTSSASLYQGGSRHETPTHTGNSPLYRGTAVAATKSPQSRPVQVMPLRSDDHTHLRGSPQNRANLASSNSGGNGGSTNGVNSLSLPGGSGLGGKYKTLPGPGLAAALTAASAAGHGNPGVILANSGHSVSHAGRDIHTPSSQQLAPAPTSPQSLDSPDIMVGAEDMATEAVDEPQEEANTAAANASFNSAHRSVGSAIGLLHSRAHAHGPIVPPTPHGHRRERSEVKAVLRQVEPPYQTATQVAAEPITSAALPIPDPPSTPEVSPNVAPSSSDPSADVTPGSDVAQSSVLATPQATLAVVEEKEKTPEHTIASQAIQNPPEEAPITTRPVSVAANLCSPVLASNVKLSYARAWRRRHQARAHLDVVRRLYVMQPNINALSVQCEPLSSHGQAPAALALTLSDDGTACIWSLASLSTHVSRALTANADASGAPTIEPVSIEFPMPVTSLDNGQSSLITSTHPLFNVDLTPGRGAPASAAIQPFPAEPLRRLVGGHSRGVLTSAAFVSRPLALFSKLPSGTYVRIPSLATCATAGTDGTVTLWTVHACPMPDPSSSVTVPAVEGFSGSKLTQPSVYDASHFSQVAAAGRLASFMHPEAVWDVAVLDRPRNVSSDKPTSLLLSACADGKLYAWDPMTAFKSVAQLPQADVLDLDRIREDGIIYPSVTSTQTTPFFAVNPGWTNDASTMAAATRLVRVPGHGVTDDFIAIASSTGYVAIFSSRALFEHDMSQGQVLEPVLTLTPDTPTYGPPLPQATQQLAETQLTVTSIAAHPVQPLLAVGYSSGFVRVYDLSILYFTPKNMSSQPQEPLSLAPMLAAPLHKRAVTTLSFSPKEGLSLASGSHDGSLRFWSTHVVVSRLTCHAERVRTLLTHSGQATETTSEAEIQSLLPLPALKLQQSLDTLVHKAKFEESVMDLAYHPTLPILFSAGADSNVNVYM